MHVVTHAQCPTGNVTLSEQSDVDQFLLDFPNCQVVLGNLTIQGTVNDISGLSNLLEVQGNLIIENSDVISINLNAVTRIDGLLKIRMNERLQDAGFRDLNTAAGGLDISSNRYLNNLTGFDLITELYYLGISDNNSMLDLPEFNGLMTCQESLNISENEYLETFNGFENLICVGSLTIHGNDRLTTISEFPSLRFIDNGNGFGLRISTNSKLTHIYGFEKLEKVEFFIIDANGTGAPGVIPKFNALKSASYIYITSMGIEEIDGFNNLIEIEWNLRIGNVQVTRIKGFQKLSSVAGIDIFENYNLKTLEAFENIKVARGTLRLYRNIILDSIIGFDKLEKVGRDLTVGANFKLTNLDFLKNVVYVGDYVTMNQIGIAENLELIDCSGISNLLNYGHVPNRIDIFNNPANCSSIIEIQNTGDNDGDGVLDPDDLDDDNDGILDTIEQNGILNYDSDNDFLPDHLDLDSNNNGCLDVVESGFNDVNDDGILGDYPDEVDANGQIINESTGYITPLDINNNSIYDFQDSNLSPIITNQPLGLNGNIGDTVSFISDITNADVFQWEVSINSGQDWTPLIDDGVYSGVDTQVLDVNNIQLTYNNYEYRLLFYNSITTCNKTVSTNHVILRVTDNLPNAGSNNTLSLCENATAIDLFLYLIGDPDPNGEWSPTLQSGTSIFDPQFDQARTYTYRVSDGACFAATAMITVRIETNPDAGTSTIIELCSDSTLINLFDRLDGTPEPEGEWTPSLVSGTGFFNPDIDLAGIYTYTVTNNCGLSTAQLTVSLNSELPNSGISASLETCINNDVTDLYNILGGTPDQDGVWTPNLSSGTGVFDPTLDSSGVYTYTVTTTSCGSTSSEVTVLIDDLPNSGSDGSLDICINSNSIDLFDSLMGSPDAGGEWTPTLTSGTGIFDPTTDTDGTYTYTVSSTLCGTVSTIVAVNIDLMPNAGVSGSLYICENGLSTNLFDSLGDSPDTTGIWAPSLSSGTGIFNPEVDTAGVYTYTITSVVCGNDTSEVTVTIDTLPFAGESAALEICINSMAIDLFDSLTDEPDTGGIWFPSLSSGSGVFDPSQDIAGIYKYTVFNGVCDSDTATVNVQITNVEPIDNYQIDITEFSNNNSITISINSNNDYEYSLDGINYQQRNIFDHLGGGDYAVFVREINGCGILEGLVSILDYPKFFTPNNDGYNDTWELSGQTKLNYNLSIYDRFGKLLKTLTVSDNSWDGTYEGRLLPSTDYWFTVMFSDSTTIRGHFTLKL